MLLAGYLADDLQVDQVVRALRWSAPNALLMAASRLHLLFGVLIAVIKFLQQERLFLGSNEPQLSCTPCRVTEPASHHRALAGQYGRRNRLGGYPLVLGRVAAVGAPHHLMRIARSACVDAGRARRLETVSLDFDMADGAVDDPLVDITVKAALAKLPDDLREAVELRYGSGLWRALPEESKDGNLLTRIAHMMRRGSALK